MIKRKLEARLYQAQKFAQREQEEPKDNRNELYAKALQAILHDLTDDEVIEFAQYLESPNVSQESQTTKHVIDSLLTWNEEFPVKTKATFVEQVKDQP